MEMSLKDLKHGHSEFQLVNFIVGGGLTPYGKYQQALREIEARMEAETSLGEQMELLTMDLKDAENDAVSEYSTGDDRRRDEIKAAGLKRARLKLERSIHENRRELDILLAAAMELKARLGELTEARKAELEADYWITKIKLMAAMDIASMGRLARETVEMMIMLPGPLRNMVIPAIKSKGLIEWMEGHE